MRADGDTHEEKGPAQSRVFDEGLASWPGVQMERDAFDRAWLLAGNRRGVRGEARLSFPADAFLALACEEGAPGAWEAFEREFTPRLRGLLKKRGASESEATETISDLPGYLCQPPADGRARTRMGTYDGSGSLFSWLAVVALRAANQRRGGPANAKRVDQSVSQVATLRSAPGRGVIAEETARRFQEVLAGAWASLTPRERLAVLLRHRDGLAGKEIARLMGVGEPRVSRLLEAGLTRLNEAVGKRMPSALSSPDSVVWKAMGNVLAQHLATLRSSPHYLAEPSDV